MRPLPGGVFFCVELAGIPLWILLFGFQSAHPQVWSISLIYREGSPPVYSSDITLRTPIFYHTER